MPEPIKDMCESLHRQSKSSQEGFKTSLGSNHSLKSLLAQQQWPLCLLEWDEEELN
ncbi:hypothetical protein PGTUg99_009445 [Puccinia graminis f. sp. tritici]|uniref:Uncharacterized protein n=1 Tax=Puccinia graminis f. sp. tritici TaxID=56615 RepID=A0A5B0SFY7_PUCGR|nr:hypothetical protein PGTUg99_009445 [Puccinia graminis f. sp. tritici]